MFSLYFIVHSLDIEGNKMVRNSSSCQQPSQILIAKCEFSHDFFSLEITKHIFWEGHIFKNSFDVTD